MIEYRAFRNTDPPQLAEVWRSQTGQRGLMQPMSASVLERYVLSRPNFDREGLIVAVEGSKLQGFAHAGFGPSEDESRLSTSHGVICLVMLRPDVDASVGAELLARAEAYLRQRGATTLEGGGCHSLAPFYFGLYGGSQFSGVLDSDPRLQALFAEHGYRSSKRSLVLHRELACFRPMVDRQQLQIRRQMSIEMVPDPPTSTWWEACVFEPFDRTRCLLLPKNGGEPPARVNFWNMDTMARTWGVHAAGVADLEVSSSLRRHGLARFLISEALRHLQSQGVALVEVHVTEENIVGRALFANLGFEQVDTAIVYRKDCASAAT